uniref:Uncharacterized protein n=1 Tax=Glossina austeni TaxID=7395 RepID=A0A1A9V2F4_GLOAU
MEQPTQERQFLKFITIATTTVTIISVTTTIAITTTNHHCHTMYKGDMDAFLLEIFQPIKFYCCELVTVVQMFNGQLFGQSVRVQHHEQAAEKQSKAGHKSIKQFYR